MIHKSESYRTTGLQGLVFLPGSTNSSRAISINPRDHINRLLKINSLSNLRSAWFLGNHRSLPWFAVLGFLSADFWLPTVTLSQRFLSAFQRSGASPWRGRLCVRFRTGIGKFGQGPSAELRALSISFVLLSHFALSAGFPFIAVGGRMLMLPTES